MMTPEMMRELQDIAYNNATLHALLQLWMSKGLTYDEWAHRTIVTLARQNDVLLAAAVDAEMRASPKPFLAERKPFITERQ
jgi:hypothetical protein